MLLVLEGHIWNVDMLGTPYEHWPCYGSPQYAGNLVSQRAVNLLSSDAL